MVLVHVVSCSLLSSLESPRQSIQYAEFAPVSRQPFNALNIDDFAERAEQLGAVFPIDRSPHGIGRTERRFCERDAL